MLELKEEMTEHHYSPGLRLRLEISDIAFGGEGVGRVDDFVIFVPFVIPGEKVEVELVEVKKRFARGRLVKLLRPSPDRVEPPCPYFGECGGCQYQHIRYARQLELKHKQIKDLFARIGPGETAAMAGEGHGVTRPELISPVIPSPREYEYRNRVMVRTQWDKLQQRLKLGFIRTDNRLVVDVHECQIAEPELNVELAKLRKAPPPKGGLKVVLRVMPEEWDSPKDSFFQNNFHLLPELARAARTALASDRGVRYLIDLYCGVGFFALELADLVERYVGVELDSNAIKAARRNAAQKNRLNGEFIAGRAEEVLPRVLERFPAAETAVLIDPPRTGCPPESLELLARARPAQIIYVSCHPATLARDLNALCEGGYTVERITPLDMFPQTQHVECVANLRLASP